MKLWKHHGAYKEAEKLYQTAIENNNKWLAIMDIMLVVNG